MITFIGISLTKKQEAIVSDERFLKQFLLFSAKAKCIKKCKQQQLQDMINPDPPTVELFKKRVPYSYLQYSYYKVSNYYFIKIINVILDWYY